MPERISPFSPSPSESGATPALSCVLHQARRLHRAAQSSALADSLPALRRLQQAAVLPAMALPELHRRRAEWRRRHFLQVLAREAGYPDWEAYRPALADLSSHDVAPDLVADAARAKPWFSTEAQALAHAALHGGRVLRVGRQAVVLPPTPA